MGYKVMKEEIKYEAGVCNIGIDEIKKRKQAGWIGIITTIVIWVLFIWFDAPHVWRFTLFFPAMISAVGFLQAYMHFCAYFGFASLFNFGDIGKTDLVKKTEFRAKDRKKAWQIIIYSVKIGIVIAVVGYYLPL